MRWIKLEQRGIVPSPRSSHVLLCDGGQVVLFGGEHEPRVPACNRVYLYDRWKKSWKVPNLVSTPRAAAVPAFPCPRIAPAAACVGSTIFILGGRTGVQMGEGSLNDLWSLQLGLFGDGAAWEQVKVEGEAPPPRSYHQMASAGTKIYVFGGCGEGGRLNDLWECDVAHSGDHVHWRQLPSSDALLPRGGAGFCALGDSLYVYGGFSGFERADVHRFDLKTETWEVVIPDDSTADGGPPRAGLPPRSVFASAAYGGGIVVFGGEVDPSTQGHAGAGVYSNQVFGFDPEAKRWGELRPEGEGPPSRGWLAGTAVPEGLLIHGGNSNDNKRQNDLWLLELKEA